MKRRISFCLIIVFFLSLLTSALVFSDQIAITKDGKKILLKDDGTWEYVKEEPEKETQYDFRSTNWGMSKEQVKKSEKDEIVQEEENFIGYQGNIGGLDCYIIYIFAEGKLVRAKYQVTETHSNKNDYVSDYNSLKENLTKKYGKPIKDEQIWKNDLYKTDYQSWGFAVSLGHLMYMASWELPKTAITLVLYGDNYEITLAIEYQSKELKGLEESAKQKKTLDEF